MNAPVRGKRFVGIPHYYRAGFLSAEEMFPTSAELPFELVILLFPGFSHVSLSSMIEPLRLANTIANRQLFAWRLVSFDGAPVEGASGIVVGVASDIAKERANLEVRKAPAAAIVCAGEGVEQQGSSQILSFLRLCARRGVWLYAVGTGTWLLAQSGLLTNVRCTIHWPKIAALSETFDRLRIDDALFVRDGPYVTCAGGFAAFDMIVDILEREFGSDLAYAVCRHMTTDHWREGTSTQAAPAGLRLAGTSDRLVRGIRLMEENLEEPLSLFEIARRVRLSRRQVERLFQRYLGVTPLQYYMSLRIARARELVESTSLSILDIAISCGFSSSSHFSKSFRDHFGSCPSSFRSLGTPVASHQYTQVRTGE